MNENLITLEDGEVCGKSTAITVASLLEASGETALKLQESSGAVFGESLPATKLAQLFTIKAACHKGLPTPALMQSPL